MYSVLQVVPPAVPFVTRLPIATALDWTWALWVAMWLSLAALLGIALGILREHTSGHAMRRVEIKRPVRRRRAQLRHA